MGKFEFNGKSTEDLGLIVQTRPTPSFPERDMSSTHVPGRNGDFYIDNKCYKNIDKTYSLAKIYRENENDCFANAEQILAWLTSANGKYAVLKDTYDSSVYRKAMFNMSGSFSDIYGEAMTFQVTFNCKPQRFLITGDIPVNLTLSGDFNTKTTLIENTYHYTTQPSITIYNIDDVLTNSDEVVMLTIRKGVSSNSPVINSITISKLGVEQGATLHNITIDSDNQDVYDANNKDRSYCVGLNGKGFPVLEDGINSIELSKYEIDTYSPTGGTGHELPTYNSLIAQEQQVVIAKYMSKNDLIQQNQQEANIISWNALIISKQHLYKAQSPKAFLETKAKENGYRIAVGIDEDTEEIIYEDHDSGVYEFASLNNVLDNIAQEYRFSGGFSDIAAKQGTDEDDEEVANIKWPTDWLELRKDGTNGITAHARISGFYFSEITNDKKIRYVEQGGSLGTANSSKTNTIRYYPTKIVNTKPVLNVAFEDVPDWLDYEFVYEPTAPYSPIEVDFYLIKSGYVWKDKSGLFGKATWQKYDLTNGQIVLLDSMLWDSGKKAFVSKKGLLPSTNTVVQYMFCDELPQYEDIVTTIIDEDGEESVGSVEPPTFIINDQGTTVEQIEILSKSAGYYKVKIGGADENTLSWLYVDGPNRQIATCKGTESFEVAYLEDIPSYTGQKNWPDWLEPMPSFPGITITEGGHYPASVLKPQEFSFVIKSTGWYRHSSVSDPEELSEWEYKDLEETPTANTISYKRINGVEAYKVAYKICRIDSMPEALPFDRQYLDNQQNPISPENVPDWFSVKYYTSKELQSDDELVDDTAYRNYIKDHPKKEIFVRFMVGPGCGPDEDNHNGYFKWDTNSVWQRKEYDSSRPTDLLASGLKDTTTLYYFDTLPQYGDFDLFNITPKPDSNGNPTVVEYTTKKAGYYRVNSNSDWTWYGEDVQLVNAKVNEAVTIRYLKLVEYDEEDPKEDPMAGIAISIIPRWWML